jgi:hypothetical protein
MNIEQREIHFLRYKIIRAPKKFKKWPRPLFRPRTNNTRHQKPSPSRETDLKWRTITLSNLSNAFVFINALDKTLFPNDLNRKSQKK